MPGEEMAQKTLVLSLSVPVSANESGNEDFSISMFENEDGYEYDPFDKFWLYSGQFYNDFSSPTISASVVLVGDDSGVFIDPCIGVYIEDFDLGPIYEVESLVIAIGEKIYKWNEMLVEDESGMSYAPIPDKHKDFLKELGEADPADVAVKIVASTDYGYYDFLSDGAPIDTKEFLFNDDYWNWSFSDLQGAAMKIYSEDTWRFITDNDLNKGYEEACPMTVE